jgi:hypothetical protein
MQFLIWKGITHMSFKRFFFTTLSERTNCMSKQQDNATLKSLIAEKENLPT